MQGNDMVKLNERPVKVDRVAELTGYSKGYIYQLVSAGKIPYRKRGNVGGKGAVRFFESEVRDWMTRNFIPAQDDINAAAERIVGGMK